MAPEIRFFLICVAMLGLALLALAYLRYVEWRQRRTRRRPLRRSPAPAPRRGARSAGRSRPARGVRPAAPPPSDKAVVQIAREAIAIAERYRRDWQATTAQLEAARAELVALRRQPDPNDPHWLDALLTAIHLLIIGHTRAGKTTLVHALATQHAAAGERVLVCDLDAAPGLWPGCLVFGFQNNTAAVDAALRSVAQEVQARRRLRGRGQRRFAPLYLVIDEYQDVLRACPAAKPLVEDVLQRGGKLGVQLIIGVPDQQVQTLGLEGRSALRKHFTYVVELRKDPQGQRWAEVLPTGEAEARVYAVPALPDPERLIRAHEQRGAAARDPLLSMLLCVMPGQGNGAARGEQQLGAPPGVQNAVKTFAGSFPDENALFSALGVGFVLPFDAEEVARIVRDIRAGKTQTEVVRGMVGYHTTKHRVFVGYYQTIANALQQHTPSTVRDDPTVP